MFLILKPVPIQGISIDIGIDRSIALPNGARYAPDSAREVLLVNLEYYLMTFMNSQISYWSTVKPSLRFLKETLQAYPRDEIEKSLGQKIDRGELDPFLLKDSTEFLRRSIINLLAYKYLVCGKYLAWGKTVIYYAQFFVLSCLLRLKGFALVHPAFFDDKVSPKDGIRPMKVLKLKIDKVKNEPKYRIQRCGSSSHQLTWKRFSELYPDLSSEMAGKYSIQQRIDWNYDVFFLSQATDKHALREVDNLCRHNFLDPNFGFSYTSEQAEHYNALMSIGYPEAGTGDYLRYAIEVFSDIGKESPYRNWYTSFFDSVLHDLSIMESAPETKGEIGNWINQALSKI